MPIYVSSAAALVLAAGVHGQTVATPRVIIAQSGDPAPAGRATSDVFASFVDSPAVNGAGKVAFAASIRPVDSVVEKTSLWSNRSGTLEIVALEGAPIAPSSSDPARAWAAFTSSGMLFLADNGRIVVTAQGSPQFAPGPYNHYAIIASEAQQDWSVLLRDGDPLPGTPGATLGVILNRPSSRADNGWILLPARTTSGATFGSCAIGEDATGLYIADDVPPPGGSLLSTVSVADTGDFTLIGDLSTNDDVIIRGRLGAVGPLLATTGQTVAFLNEPGAWAVYPNHGSQVMINGGGQMLLEAKVRDAANAAAPQMGAAVKITAAGPVLLAMQGRPAADRPGLQWGDLSASVPVVCDTGASAWWTKVQGAGVDSTNDTVVAVFADDALARIVARGGDAVVDLPGYIYGNGFQCAMTPGGRVVFNTTIRLGLTGAPTSAIFGIDHAGRVRLLAAAARTSLTLRNQVVTLTNITGANTSGGNDGGERQLMPSGDVAVRISFTGGQAVVVLPIPCPADVAGTGALPGYDGALDNNDFIAFIDFFFTGDARADRGVVGGVPGVDGQFDNNDFAVYINEFFNGCE